MTSLGFRQLARNLSLLIAGEMVRKVFTFLAFAYLARVLGPGAFGNLELALALPVSPDWSVPEPATSWWGTSRNLSAA